MSATLPTHPDTCTGIFQISTLLISLLYALVLFLIQAIRTEWVFVYGKAKRSLTAFAGPMKSIMGFPLFFIGFCFAFECLLNWFESDLGGFLDGVVDAVADDGYLDDLDALHSPIFLARASGFVVMVLALIALPVSLEQLLVDAWISQY